MEGPYAPKRGQLQLFTFPLALGRRKDQNEVIRSELLGGAVLERVSAKSRRSGKGSSSSLRPLGCHISYLSGDHILPGLGLSSGKGRGRFSMRGPGRFPQNFHEGSLFSSERKGMDQSITEKEAGLNLGKGSEPHEH